MTATVSDEIARPPIQHWGTGAVAETAAVRLRAIFSRTWSRADAAQTLRGASLFQFQCRHHDRVWVGLAWPGRKKQGAIFWLGVNISLAILQGRYGSSLPFFSAVQSNRCRRQLEAQEGLHLREDLEHPERLRPDYCCYSAPDCPEPALERRSEQVRQELSSGLRSCGGSHAGVL
jgi:hypothetical protein